MCEARNAHIISPSRAINKRKGPLVVAPRVRPQGQAKPNSEPRVAKRNSGTLVANTSEYKQIAAEVTAKKRPKNSALEVELEFDHNARPPRVITEEVTASLEDMIKARVSEDVNKSQKGLGELYDADYMQQTGWAVAPATSNDDLRSEIATLTVSGASILAPEVFTGDDGFKAELEVTPEERKSRSVVDLY
ncbi:hypothetical protein AXG93_2817s1450 [Marchantia polymorpha subsp. ruderalis]|uniref:Uncharacterized protein n=1 Tax=Marchantia polymorpha subsp. ruderalis TaxID=1480154 RepID=A0A176W2S5_MARPO|nr:hypothetical protein AXG93_2817s1450 [Marchantia polymorpha subsp. ruderalis]